MELITVTSENIAKEHICCAIANDNDCQVQAKKSWLQDRFAEGLVFLKGNIRGKCFIEYLPAEKAWVPIEADNYIYINCLWVAGQYKGQGYSKLLLNACIDDAKKQGKQGLAILTAKKKLPYLADTKFLQHHGFEKAAEFAPYFELYYLAFASNSQPPKFKVSCLNCHKTESEVGFTLYYTNQCPFTAKYVPLIEKIAENKQVALKVIKLKTCEAAQNAPTPFTSFSLFYQGEFITHEILSENKFLKILSSKGYK